MIDHRHLHAIHRIAPAFLNQSEETWVLFAVLRRCVSHDGELDAEPVVLLDAFGDF